MGRYYFDKKDVAEDCRSISVTFLRKHDYFCGYKSGGMTWTRNNQEVASIGITVSTMDDGGEYIQFRYTTTDRSTGEQTKYDYKVSLTTTPCHFGGVRYWFICPLTTNGNYCGRRVGTLYKAPGANFYGCRHCYKLSYESRNESRYGRFAAMGYILKAERQYEELYNKIKRWNYGGRPTRKARKLQVLEAKMEACHKMVAKSEGIFS